ncbi:hypothetical protein HF086_017147 [Spodoptera exigua]|uniref:Epoxide hydrolase n=1 Tax=Spodoptera exigua TaxID=7107 RepID=A0A922MG32_SPOEX|nr:hypothetical protein HF086_017147 [Spodoptera exigua]
MQELYKYIVIFLQIFKVNSIGFFRTPKVPRFEHEWWGPTHLKYNNDTSIRPFQIHFSEEMILDLRYRLKNTRSCTPPLKGVNFEYGFNTDHLQGWLDYWADHYPFQQQELYLNQFPQFKTNIQGLDIHFLWVKPDVPFTVETVPLLLMHGWPGSVREFYETLPMLTAISPDRDFAVEVIAPSLPGFGFSDPAVRPGLGTSEMAVVLRNLMHRLGFKKFYVQGGDWGAVIGQDMATIFPKLFSTGSRRRYYNRNDGGFSELFTREELIDNLMIYWMTNSFTTSARIYAEFANLRTLRMGIFAIPTPVPTWAIQAKDEIIYQSPTLLRQKFPNLVNTTVLNTGGHFLAFELPRVFANDVLNAISAFRSWHYHNKLNKKKYGLS